MNGAAKMMMIQQARRNEGGRTEGNQGARNEGGGYRNEGARNEGNYRAEGRSENRMENRMEGRSENRMGQGEYYPSSEDTEMRRRRDSRGRFMEGGAEMRDDYDFEFRRRRAGMDEESPEMRRANMYALPRGERYQNLIGFMGGNMGGNEMHYGEHRPQEQRMGYSQGSKSLDHDTAQEWVKKMKNTDGTTGQHWSMEQAKNLMTQVGVSGVQPVEFWAILNALRSDYYKVAKKFGVDRPEFYAELTKAWLDDSDAVDGKAMMYYECIVK